MTILNHEITDQGVLFICRSDDEPLSVDNWGVSDLKLPDGTQARLAGLALLLEREDVVAMDGGRLLAPHPAMASLEAWQAQGLGVQPITGFYLVMNPSGSLALPDFSFNYGFRAHDGIPLREWSRTGAFLRFRQAVERFRFENVARLLLSPIYDLVCLLDAYVRTPIQDLDQRFLWWGAVQQLLPEDIQLDGYLREIHIAMPESFTVDVAEKGGHLRITPRFVIPGDDEDAPPEDMLPPVVSQQFNERFLSQVSPRPRYALNENWFVVVPPKVQKALEVVHRVNAESEERKRGFISNPRAAIREAFENGPEVMEEEALEALFLETKLFLSERIRYLGVWEPKSGVFIQTDAGQWFPKDDPPPVLQIPLGEKLFQVKTIDLEELLENMTVAQEAGCKETTFKGTRYPVNEQSVAKIQLAYQTFVRKGPDANPLEHVPSSPEHSQEPYKPVVPIPWDHINELGISVSPENGQRSLIEIPPPLREEVRLHEHQMAGLSWMQSHWSHASPGALLADDMGLGKTLQALAFLGWIVKQVEAGTTKRRPLLVVAPTGLLGTWRKEAQKFLIDDSLGEPFQAHGAGFRVLHETEGSNVTRTLRECPWSLTTYETLRDKITVFAQVHWAVVVFDEAQKIKNPKAMMTDMAKTLKAEFSLALTGTPVENSLADIWCIVDTVQPGRLGTLKDFAREYIPQGRSNLEELERLKVTLVQPLKMELLLRRTKDEHWSEKPEKREQKYLLPMPPEQAHAYSLAVEQGRTSGERKGAMLETLQLLRAVSLHPEMNRPPGDHDRFIQRSARLQMLIEILDRIRKEPAKALIFVEYRVMQAILSEIIQRRYGLHTVMLINGAVTGKHRTERVDAFQANPDAFDVMILSPKAGGVGITLTAATHVIHLSRWWNPAVEDQCTDRVYRIGQKQPVTVHYPLAVHPGYGEEFSFDTKLHKLLEGKRSLSRNLLAPPAGTDRDVADIWNTAVLHQPGEKPPVHESLEAIDLMEPEQFEEWVANKLRNLGFEVHLTRASGDGGADGVARNKSGRVPATIIFQCKHTQNIQRLGAGAINDLLRARKRYSELAQPIAYWAITNGYFNNPAREAAKTNGIRIIERSNLLVFGV